MRNFFHILAAVAVTLIGPLRANNPVRTLLNENRVEEAAAVCRQLESVSVNDVDNSFACAWAYLRTNRLDSGDKILARNKKNFTNPEYQLLFAFAQMKRKRYDDARKIIDIVQSEQKGTPMGLLAQEVSAELYEAKNQLAPAAFIYKQVVGDDPSRARAHWGLGRYYLGRGDTGRAKTHLETTSTLWPKHLGSRFNLAVMAIAQDNLNDAAKWLTECYKLDKADPGVLEQLGVLFEKKGMIPEAVKHWQKALEIKKDSALAKEKLAQYSKSNINDLVEDKKYDEALGEMQKMDKVEEDPKLLLKRALINKNLGQWEKAMADLQVYLNSNPHDAEAMRELGICNLNQKNFNQAEELFQKALVEEPNNGLNYAWIAYLLESKGKFPQALDTWKRAIQLLKDPAEMEKAQRKVASLEKRLNKKTPKKTE